jgi:hypothetical protein
LTIPFASERTVNLSLKLLALGALTPLLALPYLAQAEEVATQPFAVVELFTSEGCSSCPPADKLLGEIVADARAHNKQVFALAFHVDYWNHLGWRDPFSDAAFSQRQRDYSGADIYTPQMIVNGTAAFVGSDRARATKQIVAALARPAAAAVQLRVAPDGFTVGYEVANAPKNALLNLALVERDLVTKVPRGENAGRTLHHDNVVRAFRTVALDGSGRGQMDLKPADTVAGEKSRVIAFVQDAKSRAIVGATGADLR